MVDKDKFQRRLDIGGGLGIAALSPIGASALQDIAKANLFRRKPSKAAIAIGITQGVGALGLNLLAAGGLAHAIRAGMKNNKNMSERERKAVELATKVVG